jgi:hypothetical protein
VINSGYQSVKLDGKTQLVHRLVAERFIENPLNLPVVDHVNHDKLNNSIKNLRWVSTSENILNLSSKNGVPFNFVKELSKEAIPILTYGNKPLLPIYHWD